MHDEFSDRMAGAPPPERAAGFPGVRGWAGHTSSTLQQDLVRSFAQESPQDFPPDASGTARYAHRHHATITRRLLDAGIARSAVCIDRSPLPQPVAPGMRFVRADACNLRYCDLGAFDLALLLNLLHHVAIDSVLAERDLVTEVLDVAPIMLVEMDSFTEQGPWR